jgi:hypothetical protein
MQHIYETKIIHVQILVQRFKFDASVESTLIQGSNFIIHHSQLQKKWTKSFQMDSVRFLIKIQL